MSFGIALLDFAVRQLEISSHVRFQSCVIASDDDLTVTKSSFGHCMSIYRCNDTTRRICQVTCCHEHTLLRDSQIHSGSKLNALYGLMINLLTFIPSLFVYVNISSA
jgi:hypothetical protein